MNFFYAEIPWASRNVTKYFSQCTIVQLYTNKSGECMEVVHLNDRQRDKQGEGRCFLGAKAPLQPGSSEGLSVCNTLAM